MAGLQDILDAAAAALTGSTLAGAGVKLSPKIPTVAADCPCLRIWPAEEEAALTEIGPDAQIDNEHQFRVVACTTDPGRLITMRGQVIAALMGDAALLGHVENLDYRGAVWYPPDPKAEKAIYPLRLTFQADFLEDLP